MCIFNDFDNKDNKFRLNRIVFPLRDKRYLTFFSQFRPVLYYVRQDMGATAPKNAVLSVARCNALQWTMQCIAFVIAPHCIKKPSRSVKRAGWPKGLRNVLKILNLGFYLFWCPPFRLLFVPSGVILSSLISHIARYVPSSTFKSTHKRRTKINAT